MFWLVEQIIGLIVAAFVVVIVGIAIAALLFGAAAVFLIALFALALLADGAVALIKWKRCGFPVTRWLAGELERG